MVQRSNSDLRLNPHYHQIALDGVYAEPEDEEAIPEFHPLPYLTSEDVADLLQLARLRILRFLTRQGAIVQTRPLEVSDAGTATAEEGLQQLAAAAVTGQVPAGPELRQRPPVPLARRARSASPERCWRAMEVLRCTRQPWRQDTMRWGVKHWCAMRCAHRWLRSE